MTLQGLHFSSIKSVLWARAAAQGQSACLVCLRPWLCTQCSKTISLQLVLWVYFCIWYEIWLNIHCVCGHAILRAPVIEKALYFHWRSFYKVIHMLARPSKGDPGNQTDRAGFDKLLCSKSLECWVCPKASEELATPHWFTWKAVHMQRIKDGGAPNAWTVTAAPIPHILVGMGVGGVLLGKVIQNNLWQIPD